MRRGSLWAGVICALAACGGPDDDGPILIEPGALPEAPAVEAAPADPVAEPPRAPEAPPVEVPLEPAPSAAPTWRFHASAVEPIVHPLLVDGAPTLRPQPATQAPVLGGTLWVDPAGTLAVVTDPGHDRVYFVDLVEGRIRAHHVLPGSEPWRIIEHDDQIWISLRRAGQVARFDRGSWALVDRVPVCGAPRGLAYDHRADLIRVACADGDLVGLDPVDGVEVERATLEPDLRDVVVTDDHLLVSTFRTPQLLVVRNGRVADYWVPRARRSARDPDLTLALPSVAWRTVAGPHGSVIMMHQRSSVEEVSISRGTGYGGRRGDCQAGLVESVATQFLSDGYVRAEATISDSPLPVDVAVVGEGGLMVASGIQGDAFELLRDHLGVFLPTADGVVGCPVPVDATPRGVGGGTVAVAFDADGRRYAVATQPFRLERHPGDGALRIELPTGASDAGRALFHTLTPANIACASCHPEGSDDGHVWLFERLGERRTQHLLGGLRASAPYHWDGEFADMDHLVSEVMGNRMGMARAGLGADAAPRMLDWLDGLPASRVATSIDRDAALRGARLFADPTVGCSGCHGMNGDPAIADSVDVGTGGLFQVPTLKGIAARPPYLHDGCAPTLRDRFSGCGGGEQHGRTAHLGEDQLSDLIAYLRAL